MKKLIVVIPTYNEVGNIAPLCRAMFRMVPKLPSDWKIELLFVDDNSPDGTANAIANIQPRYKAKGFTIHLLNNADKQGLGFAYLLGMQYAVDSLDADVIGQFDADLSHDPKKIPHLLEKIEQGYGMVIGSRYVEGGSIPANWGLYRKILSAAGNTIVRYGLGHPEIKDWSSGFRIFTKKSFITMLSKVNEEQFYGYLIMIGMANAAVTEKIKIAEVPFHFVDRTYGESKLGVEYILHTLLYVLYERTLKTFKTVKRDTEFSS